MIIPALTTESSISLQVNLHRSGSNIFIDTNAEFLRAVTVRERWKGGKRFECFLRSDESSANSKL